MPKKDKPFLCRLGYHKWGRKTTFIFSTSNVEDREQRCRRCGETKSWVYSKKYNFNP